MQSIEQSIGEHFERYARRRFRGMTRNNLGPNYPDFYILGDDARMNIGIEAKAGNRRWGARLKKYQIRSGGFDGCAYFIGLHNFDSATERLENKSEDDRQRIMDQDLQYTLLFFVSGRIIRQIWEKDWRINEKETIMYCMLKQGTINALVRARESFRRHRQVVFPEPYYGFSYEDYVTFDYTVKRKGKETRYCGLLHKTRDRVAIEFLRRRGIRIPRYNECRTS
jgi:hypothetical protein